MLYGGTALALRLRHRESVDFDFFSTAPFSPADLRPRIPYLVGARVIQSAPNTLTCTIDAGGPVRASFFGGLNLRSVEPPDRAADNGVLVASLIDLAGTKAGVVQNRASAKDYVDIDAIIHAGITLGNALAAAAAIYGQSEFNPLVTLKALTYYDEGDLRTLPSAVRERLSRAVAQVDPTDLPRFASRPGLTREEIDDGGLR